MKALGLPNSKFVPEEDRSATQGYVCDNGKQSLVPASHSASLGRTLDSMCRKPVAQSSADLFREEHSTDSFYTYVSGTETVDDM